MATSKSKTPKDAKSTFPPQADEEQSHEFVLRMAQDRNVKFVRLWFTDILGSLKSIAITSDELEAALEEGVTFDGSSIEGFARAEESDMIARPDASTFAILPSEADEGQVARIFCDIVLPGDRPAQTDPRRVLREQLQRAAEMGYIFYVGPEVEFFYFEGSEESRTRTPKPLDEGGYFDLTPHDVASPLRRHTALALESMDIGVESSHHEGAPSQHEIDLRYTDALTMADNLMTFRLVVKEVAAASGYYATFMPKPLAHCNGSGMHINMSLFEGARNAFYDARSKDKLSKLAKYFLAGLLEHARELTLFTNQWVNSYKRLVPGYEAPTQVTWAMNNHSDLLRVPTYKPGRDDSRRLEYRSPDAACNPYLVFALLLAAGLDGVQRQLALPESGKQPNAEVLPGDLSEAIACARKSTLAREVLGEQLFDKFLMNKTMEWEDYRRQVHHYEIQRYLGVL